MEFSGLRKKTGTDNFPWVNTKRSAASPVPSHMLKMGRSVNTSTRQPSTANGQRSSVIDNRQPSTVNRQPIIGITGTGGAGKSSVTDEIVRRFLQGFPEKTIAVISVDPSKKKTGGALLGDRIRMNSIHSPRAYMRSLATRETDVALSAYVQEALDICRKPDSI